MIYLNKIILLYCMVCCVACLVHMWRNREDRDTVIIYADTFLIFVMLIMGLSI